MLYRSGCCAQTARRPTPCPDRKAGEDERGGGGIALIGAQCSPHQRQDARDERLHRIKGQPPSLIFVPPGCAFHPRCEYAQLPDPCATATPPLYPTADPGHLSACHFANDLDSLGTHDALVDDSAPAAITGP